MLNIRMTKYPEMWIGFILKNGPISNLFSRSLNVFLNLKYLSSITQNLFSASINESVLADSYFIKVLMSECAVSFCTSVIGTFLLNRFVTIDRLPTWLDRKSYFFFSITSFCLPEYLVIFMVSFSPASFPTVLIYSLNFWLDILGTL